MAPQDPPWVNSTRKERFEWSTLALRFDFQRIPIRTGLHKNRLLRGLEVHQSQVSWAVWATPIAAFGLELLKVLAGNKVDSVMWHRFL